MKTITIGRGDRCNIVIDDNRVSRQHALLRIYPLGKMEIVDQSQNGTWVNGVRIKSGRPFPIKRKDVVNFAGASQLNWSMVPNPMKCVWYAVWAALAVIAVIIAALALSRCQSEDSLPMGGSEVESVRPAESPNPAESPRQETTVAPKAKPAEKQVTQESVDDDEALPQTRRRGRTVNELFPVVAKPQPVQQKENAKAGNGKAAKKGDAKKSKQGSSNSEERKDTKRIAM